tara:strand:- start:4949 stop:5884 length:936 start_codon:yes stop_codon:yes gene_type:complete
MKGYVEIYQGSIKDENLIFSEPNMIVDTAGHHIVDVLTSIPTPSSLSIAEASGIQDFGIKAITLGSAQGSTSYNSYSVSSDSGPSSLLGIAPNPIDTSLQPVTPSGPGSLGHFLNYYQFSGSYSGLDMNEIRQHGCYLPSAGISFAGSSFGFTDDGSVVSTVSGLKTGDFNTSGVINSEGYILESPVARGSQALADASGGFIVSGSPIMDVSAIRSVKYILTISYMDWKFLDYYYGGIGAIGLWTLDREATLDKYNSESETAVIDLYNVADVSRNPIFKLFAKKVFLPGGLKIDEASSNDDYMTITWEIKF